MGVDWYFVVWTIAVAPRVHKSHESNQDMYPKRWYMERRITVMGT